MADEVRSLGEYIFVDGDDRQLFSLRSSVTRKGAGAHLAGHVDLGSACGAGRCDVVGVVVARQRPVLVWNDCTDERGHLLVVCPSGQSWDIDSRASNCTMPDDRTHRCWVRHGEPPNLTVDKAGKTCAAGAGSIIAGSYHGFLRNGELT